MNTSKKVEPFFFSRQTNVINQNVKIFFLGIIKYYDVIFPRDFVLNIFKYLVKENRKRCQQICANKARVSLSMTAFARDRTRSFQTREMSIKPQRMSHSSYSVDSF